MLHNPPVVVFDAEIESVDAIACGQHMCNKMRSSLLAVGEQIQTDFLLSFEDQKGRIVKRFLK